MDFLPKPPTYGTPFGGPGTDPGYINPLMPPTRNPFAGPYATDPVQMPYMIPGMGAAPGPIGRGMPPSPIQMPFMVGGRRLGNRPRPGAPAPMLPRRPFPPVSDAIRGLFSGLY